MLLIHSLIVFLFHEQVVCRFHSFNIVPHSLRNLFKEQDGSDRVIEPVESSRKNDDMDSSTVSKNNDLSCDIGPTPSNIRAGRGVLMGISETLRDWSQKSRNIIISLVPLLQMSTQSNGTASLGSSIKSQRGKERIVTTNSFEISTASAEVPTAIVGVVCSQKGASIGEKFDNPRLAKIPKDHIENNQESRQNKASELISLTEKDLRTNHQKQLADPNSKSTSKARALNETDYKSMIGDKSTHDHLFESDLPRKDRQMSNIDIETHNCEISPRNFAHVPGNGSFISVQPQIGSENENITDNVVKTPLERSNGKKEELVPLRNINDAKELDSEVLDTSNQIQSENTEPSRDIHSIKSQPDHGSKDLEDDCETQESLDARFMQSYDHSNDTALRTSKKYDVKLPTDLALPVKNTNITLYNYKYTPFVEADVQFDIVVCDNVLKGQVHNENPEDLQKLDETRAIENLKTASTARMEKNPVNRQSTNLETNLGEFVKINKENSILESGEIDAIQNGNVSIIQGSNIALDDSQIENHKKDRRMQKRNGSVNEIHVDANDHIDSSIQNRNVTHSRNAKSTTGVIGSDDGIGGRSDANKFQVTPVLSRTGKTVSEGKHDTYKDRRNGTKTDLNHQLRTQNTPEMNEGQKTRHRNTSISEKRLLGNRNASELIGISKRSQTRHSFSRGKKRSTKGSSIKSKRRSSLTVTGNVKQTIHLPETSTLGENKASSFMNPDSMGEQSAFRDENIPEGPENREDHKKHLNIHTRNDDPRSYFRRKGYVLDSSSQNEENLSNDEISSTSGDVDTGKKHRNTHRRDNIQYQNQNSQRLKDESYLKEKAMCVNGEIILPNGEKAGSCYSTAAVTTEVPECSRIGTEILLSGGNALDAAIAATLCVGVVNSFSSGIGGGGFLLVLKPTENGDEVDSFDFRETAPRGAKSELFDMKDKSKIGGLAVGVPGEISGLLAAHKRHGKMAWEKLFESTIRLCESFTVSEQLHRRLVKLSRHIFEDPGLKDTYTKDGKIVKPGDKISRMAYAETLREISKNPDSFYTGNIGEALVKTVRQSGGVMTMDDLRGYSAVRRDPLKGEFRGYSVHSTGLPSSGVFLLHALRVLEHFDLQELRAFGKQNDILNQSTNSKELREEGVEVNNVTSSKERQINDHEVRNSHENASGLEESQGASDLKPPQPKQNIEISRNVREKTYLSGAKDSAPILNGQKSENDNGKQLETLNEYPHYQLLVELFKFMGAFRGKVADPAFMHNWEDVVAQIISPEYAEQVARKIDLNKTHDPQYYDPKDSQPDHGTTHINVLDEDGMAVGITSTINLEFGAKISCQQTGIILNNQMDDFYIPGTKNAFDLVKMPLNIVEPGKKPFSSAAPLILKKHNEIILLGAAGGTRIPTSILGIVFHLLLGRSIQEAIEKPRIHHQFMPNILYIENTLKESIGAYFRRKGHAVEVSATNSIFTSVQGIHAVTMRDGNCIVQAVSDPRKGGLPDGY